MDELQNFEHLTIETPAIERIRSTPQTHDSTNSGKSFYSISPYSLDRELLGEERMPDFYQAAEDEQIVNFALILLLDSAIHESDVKGHWSPYRFPMVCRNGTDKLYEARVDGVFRRTTDEGSEISQPSMIVEVKANSRGHEATMVAMQEAAQIAAWIACQPTLYEDNTSASERK